MNDWTQWRNGMRQLDLLAHWRERGHLDADAWQRARAVVDAGPAGAPWRGVLQQLSLWLSVVLLGSAVICFIAANWDALDRYARLFGVQALLLLAALAAWRLGPERPAGQAALLLAGLLLGGLLALFGQTWQTGADTWQLFALWAALLLPWLVAASGPAMNLLWALVVNVALLLWVAEWSRSDQLPWLTLGVLNSLLAGLWLWAGRHVPGLAGALGPRLLLATGLFGLTLAALADVFGWRGAVGAGALLWLLLLVASAALAFRRRDLALLAVAALSVITVLTAVLARVFFDALDLSSSGLLLLTLAVIGQIGFAGGHLRRLATEWADEHA